MPTYQTSNPPAVHSPPRFLPLFRSPARVFGPSSRDRLVGALRTAEGYREGWAREFAKACAGLGRANRTAPQNRRAAQSQMMRQLNAVRACLKANLRDIAKAQAALAGYDANPPLPGVELAALHARLAGVPAWPAEPAPSSPAAYAAA